MFATMLVVIQLVVSVVVGLYFFRQLRQSRQKEPARGRESNREMERMRHLRSIHLSEPLAEKVRPTKMSDVIGQEDGIRSLKAILCGANPQHVLIYGPPGIGKTCAARLVLEYAKHSPGTPFKENAPFIEMDATCVRFDERSIADPLFGSVHDPIYQGAGSLGVQGVPQPKPGAVTKAHGGVLFLDELPEYDRGTLEALRQPLEDGFVNVVRANAQARYPARAMLIADHFARNPKENPLLVTVSALFTHFQRIFILNYQKWYCRRKGVPMPPDAELARMLKLPTAFFLKEYQQAAALYPNNKVFAILGLLREYDLKSKGMNTGQADGGELLKELLLKIFLL